MRKFLILIFLFFFISCVKQVKPTSDQIEPVFIEEDTTTYQPIEIVKDTVPKNVVEDTVPKNVEIKDIETTVKPAELEMPKYIYRIQIGAFKIMENANKLKSEIDNLFKVSVIIKYEDGFYKVRVGEFNTRTEAEAFLNKLRISGYNGFIKVEEVK